MICKRCNYDNSIVEVSTDPCWAYKLVNGEVKGELFHPKEIPEGWFDSPKAAKAPKEPETPKVVEKCNNPKHHGKSKKR